MPSPATSRTTTATQTHRSVACLASELKIIQEQVGHEHASTTSLYTNPRELHQTGEKPQVAWSLGEAEPVRRVYGLAS